MCVCVRTRVCVCVCVRMCVCVGVCVYIHIHVHVHACMHKLTTGDQFISGAHERAKREGASYSAYAGGTSYQPSSNSGKALIWPTTTYAVEVQSKFGHGLINLAEIMFHVVHALLLISKSVFTATYTYMYETSNTVYRVFFAGG